MAKMTVGLSTSSIDKLTSVGVILSGAAADDMEVDLFVLVNAGHAFLKNKAENISAMSEDIQTSEEFKASLEKVSSPSWLEFFEMAKELTEVKIHICSLAGKIAGGEKMEDFIDIVDDICGIGEYIESIQNTDINIFI
ncbi:MAG: DsrE/DsrF/DrsH-like family protein [Bacteroidales bacterium]|nr:DsrE/DsrF/DrsH-like family protein [Bacteroidales bacterium]